MLLYESTTARTTKTKDKILLSREEDKKKKMRDTLYVSDTREEVEEPARGIM